MDFGARLRYKIEEGPARPGRSTRARATGGEAGPRGAATMTAKELLDDGRLGPAIDQLGREVKGQPSDARLRTSLFELLCFAGDWDRAGRQLDALGALDDAPNAHLGLDLYRRLLEGERQRVATFQRGVRPRLMLEPTAEVAHHLDAVAALAAGRPADARAALDRAAEAHRAVAGRLGNEPFDEICDADDLLGPVLEVFAPVGYCWVPWSQLQFVEVTPPKTLRDLLWAPARIASFDGQLGEVYLPALYPGTSGHADDAVRLGRKTEWVELDGGTVRGAGRKVFLVGDDDRGPFELTDLQLTPPAPSEDDS